MPWVAISISLRCLWQLRLDFQRRTRLWAQIIVNSVFRKAYRRDLITSIFMTDISPPIAERENEVDSELLGIRVVVSQVYKSVWEDFSVWEEDHSRQTLQSLSRPSRPHLNPLLISSGQSHSAIKETRSTTHNVPNTVVESFDDSDLENGSTSTVLVTVHTIGKGPMLQSLSYESCTPISRNLMIGDDSDFLPFIPNSDDPSYDYTYDIEEHNFFAWHRPNRDPDCALFDPCSRTSFWLFFFLSFFQ